MMRALMLAGLVIMVAGPVMMVAGLVAAPMAVVGVDTVSVAGVIVTCNAVAAAVAAVGGRSCWL